MKQLHRYLKRKGKADPFHGDKGPKGFKGPDGVKKADQYASKSGKKIVEDSKDYEECEPGEGMEKIGAYESIKSNGKKKQRNYLKD